ncbi:MAG: magnesium transporter [Cyclobacteriaceae bacterium]|nr:magnesium transporter [Cyclobacteriaceae bacterium]
MENVAAFQFSQEFLDRFSEAIEERNDAFIRESLESVRHEDVSLLLEEFDPEDSKYVLELLEKEVASDVIEDLDEDTRSEILTTLNPKEIAAYIDRIETDDATDILNDLPVKIREEVIAGISNPEKVDHIVELMRYEEDCAGGLMAKELIKANVNWNVVQCIDEIRSQAENVEKFYAVYVVDANDKLLGRLALKELILSKSNIKIADIYSDEVISVFTYQDQNEVVEIMQKYDLEAIPVVNVSGKLVGRITIDDIVDVIKETADEERNLMAGISEDVEPDDSIWLLSRARLPWLIIGLLGGIFGAKFIGIFQDEIQKVAALAFFIPLIIATGGNVGVQSSALVVQSLASVNTFVTGPWGKFLKTLLVAIINGVVLATLIFAFVYLSYDSTLAFVVAVALFANVIFASLVGTFIPLLLDKLGFNPALASGPFITTAIDLMGLGLYFTIAHFLYAG